MLEGFINFICAFIMAIDGYYIIKKFSENNTKISIKIIIYLIINSIVITLIHYRDSQTAFVLNFIVNVLTYKSIFKNNIIEYIVETAMPFEVRESTSILIFTASSIPPSIET